MERISYSAFVIELYMELSYVERDEMYFVEGRWRLFCVRGQKFGPAFHDKARGESLSNSVVTPNY